MIPCALKHRHQVMVFVFVFPSCVPLTLLHVALRTWPCAALSLRPVVLETMANLALSLPLPTVQFQVFGAAVPFSLWPPVITLPPAL